MLGEDCSEHCLQKPRCGVGEASTDVGSLSGLLCRQVEFIALQREVSYLGRKTGAGLCVPLLRVLQSLLMQQHHEEVSQ